MSTIPSKLYKYQPYTTWSLDNLKDRRLWFSKPSNFNDPFDCAMDLDIAEMSEDEWRAIYETREHLIPNLNLGFLTDSVPNKLFRKSVFSASEEAFKLEKEKMLNDKGVACFAEKIDNLLMWSHYADGHRGFCLEFNTKHEPFRSVFPVNYSDEAPIVNPFEILVNKNTDPFMEMIKTKSRHWSYEKEWRCFHKQGDHGYGVEPAALTGVYFGCMMPNVHKEIISLILRDSPTYLYTMHKEGRKFKVISKKMNYSPFDYGKKTSNPK